jgi:hypothetical protein
MPTISEHQLLIEAILLAGEEDTDQRHWAEPTAIDQSGEEGGPSLLPSGSSGSSKSSSESSSESSKLSKSSSESSSSELLSCSESHLGLESEDTDEENMRQHMADILQAVMETRVLNPHEVPKCL